MQNTDKISVAILVKNAQDTIEECLAALKPFGEVVLLDNGSTDKTVEIAKQFTNVKIFHEPNFQGFGKMKNLAGCHATNDWILSIDSDEILLPETIEKINAITLNDNTIVALSRLNYYSGKCMKCCGWYPDFVWRIYNRKVTEFNTNLVHEGVNLKNDAEKIYIKDAIKHYTADCMETIINKTNKYSTLSAQEKFSKGKKTSVAVAIIKFFYTFNRDYFFRKGIFYGYRGFIISVLNANASFLKYMKLHEMNSTKK